MTARKTATTRKKNGAPKAKAQATGKRAPRKVAPLKKGRPASTRKKAVTKPASKPRKKPGQKPIEIDIDQLAKLAVLGTSVEDAAWLLGISERTLQRRLNTEVEEDANGEPLYTDIQKAWFQGQAMMRQNCRVRLLNLSKSSAGAAIFLAKNNLGMRDHVAISDPDGGAFGQTVFGLARQAWKSQQKGKRNKDAGA